jgi:2'-5' RNA ligase
MNLAARFINRVAIGEDIAAIYYHYFEVPSRVREQKDRSADPGVMLAFWIPEELAHRLALPSPEAEPPDAMHITVVYFGRMSELGQGGLDRAAQVAREICSVTPILDGKLAGMGRFAATDASDGKDVLYTSIDVPGLSDLRHELVTALDSARVTVKKSHDYTPHSTLAYVQPTEPTPSLHPDSPIRQSKLRLDTLSLVRGDEELEKFPLMGVVDAYGETID